MVLDIQKLKIDFYTEQGVFSAVNELSLTLEPGEVLALIGESGCGKSITALSILGLLPPAAQSDPQSKIVFQGKDLARASLLELEEIRGRQIGMVFQEPMTSLNPVFTIGNQVSEIFRKHLKIDKKAAKIKTLEILSRVQLPEPEKIYHQYPHELSGGMRQRVVVAMAVALNPALLIADEPTTALDVTIQAEIMRLFEDLKNHEQHETAVIFISHNLLLLKDFADRIAIMYLGEVVEEATTNDLFATPLHPYTQGLLAAIPYVGNEERLVDIPGTVPPLSQIPSNQCRFYERCSQRMARCLEAHPDFYGETEHRVRCYLYAKD